jgi:hypothetical protein
VSASIALFGLADSFAELGNDGVVQGLYTMGRITGIRAGNQLETLQLYLSRSPLGW